MSDDNGNGIPDEYEGSYFDPDELEEMGIKRIPGTINRPLLGEFHRDPTIRWGDATQIELPPGTSTGVTKDLLNVPLDTARVCQVQLHAELLKVHTPGPPSSIDFTNVELAVGCGSQLTTIRKRFAFWPMFATPVGSLPPGTPLDVTFTLPLNNLRGRVTVQGANIIVGVSLWITPLLSPNSKK